MAPESDAEWTTRNVVYKRHVGVSMVSVHGSRTRSNMFTGRIQGVGNGTKTVNRRGIERNQSLEKLRKERETSALLFFGSPTPEKWIESVPVWKYAKLSATTASGTCYVRSRILLLL